MSDSSRRQSNRVTIIGLLVLLAVILSVAPFVRFSSTLVTNEPSVIGRMIVNGNPLTDIQRAASANPKVLFEPEPNGRSLLYLSVWEGRVDVMEWLLSQGLDPNAKQSTTFGGAGKTSLQLAASLGNLAAVRILCQYGADPLKNDHNGFNSIEIANGMDAKEVALFLEEWVKQKKR